MRLNRQRIWLRIALRRLYRLYTRPAKLLAELEAAYDPDEPFPTKQSVSSQQVLTARSMVAAVKEWVRRHDHPGRLARDWRPEDIRRLFEAIQCEGQQLSDEAVQVIRQSTTEAS
jgi:hypothetical protein